MQATAAQTREQRNGHLVDRSPDHRAARVMIVGGDSRMARFDRSTLKSLYLPEPMLETSGVRAARALLAHGADLVFCHGELADMTGLAFIRLLRSHPALAAIPLVLIDDNAEEQTVLAARDAGCTGYLLRPYTINAVLRQIRLAASCPPSVAKGERPSLDDDTFLLALDNLEEQLPEAAAPRREARSTVQAEGVRPESEDPIQESASAAVPETRPETPAEAGQRLMREERFGLAARAFERALRANPGDPDAHLGLAAVWKKRGHPANHRMLLSKAVEHLARDHRHQEARQALADLRKLHPGAGNPFLPRANSAVRNGRFRDAVAALEFVTLTESGDAADPEPLFREMARMCHFTSDPQDAARELCKELERSTVFNRHQGILRRIMGPEAAAPKAMELSYSRPTPRVDDTPRAFPTLRDALAVARFTMGAYRKGGVEDSGIDPMQGMDLFLDVEDNDQAMDRSPGLQANAPEDFDRCA